MSSWTVVLDGVAFQADQGEDLPASISDEQVVGSLSRPPDGLGVPPLRVEDQAHAQRDGVTHYKDWYDSRIITLENVMFDEDENCQDCSVRERVRLAMDTWSRRCDDVEMVIFTDCDGEDEDRSLVGPFGVIGRPRVADLTWHTTAGVRSATATLRFDSVDHRLYILDEQGTPGSGGDTFSLPLQERDPEEPLPGPNLVYNGDFEINPTGWTGGSSTAFPVHDGSRALAVTAGNTSTSPWFSVTADAAFDARVWVRSETMAGSTTPLLGSLTVEFDSGPSYTESIDIRSTSWQEIQVTGQVPSGATQGRLVLGRGPAGFGSGFAAFDDAYFGEFDDPIVPTPDPRLVKGSLCVPAIITFTGRLSYPRIQLDDGNYVGWDGVINNGQTVVINTATGKATYQGNVSLTQISGDPFFNLPPGNPEFTFTTVNNSDTGTVSIYYRPAVISA